MEVEKQKMLNSARITCNFLHLHPGDRALLCMSLDYIAGKMMVVRSIERNLKLVCVEPSGHPMAGDEAREPFDLVAMVPLQVYNSLQVPEERRRLMQTRHLIIGGGAISATLEKELKQFPNFVWSTYAMTETLSHIALRRLNGPEASSWYTPFESVNISQNADGCLVIDAPLVHDGKLTTHDRVEIRGNRFRILGRIDNVICSGGIKIQIEEVEARLQPLLAKPFMVSRKKDEKFGEVVVLLTEDSDLQAVRSVCEAALPKYWQPKFYYHVDALPMTETKKPARAEAERLIERL
jgi:O-succinylbenzoic acid--CoA ligase